ncbi:hypothetical protein [Gramella sp. AN32]|uniref:STAS/SEC14 domain-containing protein n=1 Tax=Christiangramia antarctica TaxID=2058158 RepID=A0ABW5X6R1_9FLAO|nr:hypothetical protein [Gramella sp. AN32]MCM4156030.1 hypothetical protein [Gramella sp. AN32]
MVDALKIQKIDFATIEFYPNFVVAIINPEENLDLPQVRILEDIVEDYYKGNEYIYLSYRKNDYSVNPLLYSSLIDIKSLKAIGIVSESFSRLQIANFEKQFCPIPYEIFNSLDEAKAWASGYLNE